MPNASDVYDEINVEEIMEKIRQNIREKKELETVQNTTYRSNQHNILSERMFGESNVQRDLDYINLNWEITNKSYFINSHRPVAGKFLVRGRELVHGEIRRYVDPVIWKQSEFNGSAVRLLNDVNNRLISFDAEINKLRPEIDIKIDQLRPEIDTKIDQLRPEIDTKIDQLRPEIDTKIDQLRPEIDTKIDQLRPEIDTKIDKLRLEINKKIDHLKLELLDRIIAEINTVIYSMGFNKNSEEFLSVLESKVEKDSAYQKTMFTEPRRFEINYLSFENKFRGSSEDIRERQSNFMNYFSGCSSVLDIGCGRGEFLELAEEQGIGVKGIDIDDTMVDYCLSKGLKVEQADAVSYLRKIEDNSLDGIFVDQVVEHIEPSSLVDFFCLCFKKLKYGCYIFVETVNPLSFVSFSNFYIDMTHKKPVHPETLKFLLTSVGFRDLETNFLSPVAEQERLQKISVNDNIEDNEKKYLNTYNYNVEKLNNLLYGAQDYAVIGKK